jgi:hypothetical protein
VEKGENGVCFFGGNLWLLLHAAIVPTIHIIYLLFIISQLHNNIAVSALTCGTIFFTARSRKARR